MRYPLFSQRLERLAAVAPNSACLSDGKASWGRRELMLARDRMAAALTHQGIEAGQVVAIKLAKSRHSVALILACLKLGVLFCPMDPHAPDARQRLLLAQIKPALIVVSDAAVGEGLRIGELIALASVSVSVDWDTLPQPHADSPAYCIFTSGSSGTPKGAVVSHGALAALCQNLTASFPIDETDSFLSLGPLFFDISVVDLLYPLSQGAHVRVYDLPALLPAVVADMVSRHAMTAMCAVTRVLDEILKAIAAIDNEPLATLRKVMTGGETPTRMLIQSLWMHAPNARVFNGYGPTEFTCTCIVHEIGVADLSVKAGLPIGYPIDGVAIRIEDENGVESDRGELLLSGPQLFSEYVGAASEYELRTALREGRRFYRTGDLVQRWRDGRLCYLSRLNEEIKVNGVRVNLAEIKLAIEQEFGVDQFMPVFVRAANGDSQLCIACTRAAVFPSIEILRSKLIQRLPSYLIPKFVYQVDSMPMLPGGKSDRKALERQIEEALLGLEENANVQLYR